MGKIKLAFSTLGCPEWSFDKILSEAVRMGYGAVEIRGIEENLAADTIPELQSGNISATREKLLHSGISVCAVDCSAVFTKPDALEASLSEGRHAVDAASGLALNAEKTYVRVFGDRIYSTDSIRLAAEGIALLCDYASDKGVSVLLETHGDFNTSARMLETAERVGRENFGILWDIEHTYNAGENQADFAKRLYQLIRHVHLKDIDSGGKLCLPSDGVLNLQAAVDSLRTLGYDGYFSLEWEKRWKPELPEPEMAFGRYIELMNG